jgi:glycosyltransferase involved in cell wall biosynthesis
MISSIIKRATRKAGDRLQILVFSAHERYEPLLCGLNADFYALSGEHVRKWNEKYSKIPENYTFLKDNRIPDYVVPDLIISHNPFAHIPLGIQYARQYSVPLLNIFHTEPPIGWTKESKLQNNNFFSQCAHHVFITQENLVSWGFSGDKNCTVIEHAIDSELFCEGNLTRENRILSVGNDFIGRNHELGYDLWKYLTKDLTICHVKVIGNTPGLSKPAESIEELVSEYQKSRIFLNTSLRSPIPMSLIEAASCGCAIVTTNMNAIPDFFEHFENAFIFSPQNPEKGKEYLIELIKNPEKCERMGKKAREMVLKRFSMDRFLKEWSNLLENICEQPYLG